MSSTPNEAVYTAPRLSFKAFGTVFLDGPLFGMKLTSSNSLNGAYHPFGHPYIYTCFY